MLVPTYTLSRMDQCQQHSLNIGLEGVHAGKALPIEFIVEKQTRRNALLYGLKDRGALQAGMRADINVIDMNALSVDMPVSHADFPAGGARLLQKISGYEATLLNGVITRRRDQDTGARPGRLVRGGSRL